MEIQCVTKTTLERLGTIFNIQQTVWEVNTSQTVCSLLDTTFPKYQSSGALLALVTGNYNALLRLKL